MYFFFQAEDGIRDYKVTGVQTCALPISSPRKNTISAVPPGSSTIGTCRAAQASRPAPVRLESGGASSASAAGLSRVRSEERRVGKEGRYRWMSEQEKVTSGRRCSG